MLKPSKRDRTEVHMLSLLYQKSMNGFDLLMALNNNRALCDECFSDLHMRGYCSVVYEEYNGEIQGVYHITPKGENHLLNWLMYQNSAAYLYHWMFREL